MVATGRNRLHVQAVSGLIFKVSFPQWSAMPWWLRSNLPCEPALDLLTARAPVPCSKSLHKTPQVVVRHAAEPGLAKRLSDYRLSHY